MKNHKTNNYIISKFSAMLLALALCLSPVMPMAGIDVYADNEGGSVASEESLEAAAKDSAQDEAAEESKTAVSENTDEEKAEPAETEITGYKKSYNKRYHQTLKIEADISPAGGREVQLQRYNSEDKSWTTILTATAGRSVDEDALAEPDDDSDADADAEAAADTDASVDTEPANDSDVSANTEQSNSSDAEEDAFLDLGDGSDADADSNAADTDAALSDAGEDTAAEVDSADEEEEDGVAHVTFNVPKEERQKTTSKWRIYVPATENAAEATSRKITVITRNLEDISISARSACIYRIDGDGKGTMIYSRNSYKEVAQASTTKLMTAILLVESGLMNSTTKVSSHAASTPYASGHMSVGDVFNTSDLLYAMLLPSSNDAATAVAERVGGNEAAFVNMMNAKAEKLGLTRTHFRNPHGLDADGHYTTAKELAKLTAYAYTIPEIRDCWATQYKSIKSLEKGRRWNLWSTNAIFGYVSNFLGGKTGTESNAGCCFTGVYTYNGSTYVTVVLGSGYGFSRWSDTKRLHKYIQDYALSSY